MGSISPRGNYPTSFASGAEIRLMHQAGHPFTRAADPSVAQFGVQARTSISAMMSTKPLPDLFGEQSIFSLALAGRALAPRIIATFRDRKHSAHDHNGKFLLVLFNKLILHLDSREKMLRTFLRISRSCWTLASSRLRRRFSSSSAVWCPLPGNASLP